MNVYTYAVILCVVHIYKSLRGIYMYIYMYIYTYKCVYLDSYSVCGVYMTHTHTLSNIHNTHTHYRIYSSPYQRDDILQKRPIVLRSLLTHRCIVLRLS